MRDLGWTRCRSWRIRRWRLIRCDLCASHAVYGSWHLIPDTGAGWRVRRRPKDRRTSPDSTPMVLSWSTPAPDETQTGHEST